MYLSDEVIVIIIVTASLIVILGATMFVGFAKIDERFDRVDQQFDEIHEEISSLTSEMIDAKAMIRRLTGSHQPHMLSRWSRYLVPATGCQMAKCRKQAQRIQKIAPRARFTRSVQLNRGYY